MAAGVRIHTSTRIAMTDPHVRWIAPTITGLGHAYPGRRHEKAACGALAVDERFAYPVTRRCDDCLVIVGAEQVRTGQEIPETVQRALWGDR
jgi:hypothetical protein